MEPLLSKYLTCKPYPYLLLFLCFFINFFPKNISATSSDFTDYKVVVTDAKTSEPIIGVTVVSADTSFTGVTDIDGVIVLQNISHLEIIHFSYIGYETLSLSFKRIRDMKGQIRMIEASEIIEPIVVYGRQDKAKEEIPYLIDTYTREDISFSNAQTSADILSSKGGVFIQKSQMGGGSPVIRGFEANKVLLVLDGVRMNNAIYREGHLQNSITVDNSILERAEVIYGPGSLIYGSDALGGVVHYRTRDPKVLFNDVKDFDLHTNANIRFSSANMEKFVHFDFDYADQKWGSITSISYVDYDDLRAGAVRSENYPDFGKRPFYVNINENVDETRRNSDPNIQIGTGYSQLDFLQKIRMQPSEKLYFIANIQFSTSSNVPRYDMLTDTVSAADDLKWAEWYYGPQNRFLTSLKTKILKRTFLHDKVTMIMAYQRIDEDRLKRKFHKSHRTFNNENVHVYSFTTDLDKYLDKKEKHVLTYGVDATHNKVFSTAGNLNVRTGAVSRNELTRYPSDRSEMTTFGSYINYRWKNRDSTINFNAGLRYSMVQLFAKYLEDDLIDWDSSLVTEGLTVQNTDLTWATGLTFNTKKGWQLHLLASSAFRSPNIDDFAKIREKDGFVLVPNIDLVPEKAINGEVTLGKAFGKHKGAGKYQISVTGFYTYLDNAIIRQNATFFGDTMLVVEESAKRVQKNVNANSAYIMGASGNILFDFNDHWQFRSSVNYVKGRSIIDDVEIPLAHIPPMYANASFSWKRKKFKIEANVRYNAQKPLSEYGPPGSSDNEDRATPEGTLEWTTYNLYTSFQLSKSIGINLAVENILDTHYRPFASGVSAAGRNFIVAIKGNF